MKYVLMPGVGVARGMRHYIGAPQLARLYNVEMIDCVIWEPGEPEPVNLAELMILTPHEDGVYILEEQ